jgi:hypothetical protein
MHHHPVATTVATAPQPVSLAQRPPSFTATGPVSVSALATVTDGAKPAAVTVPQLALGKGAKNTSGATLPPTVPVSSSAPNSARGSGNAQVSWDPLNGPDPSQVSPRSDFVFAQPSSLPPRDKF